MVMCARCHKRIAVVFITKMENGQRTSEGLCMRCAKEVGLPVNNMLDGIAGQMGITPDQIASMEDSMNEMMAAPSESDGVEDGGAPAIDMPSLFGEDGAEGEAEADKPIPEQKFTIKVNKEIKEVSYEDAPAWIQKGMDYDRVKNQLETSRENERTFLKGGGRSSCDGSRS